MKFTCRPEGDGVYLPIDLYTGTFDRIRTQVFAQSCAVSACHDSEGNAGGMILLSGVAYANLVGVTPTNNNAAVDGAGPRDPGRRGPQPALPEDRGWPAGGLRLADAARRGRARPVAGRAGPLWIVGDMILGPAPETGWVEGTDQ